MVDPIANMIVSLKNAGDAGLTETHIPYSKFKEAIAQTLVKEHFVKSVEKRSHKGKPSLHIELFVENRIPRIKGVKRLSHVSKRIYKKADEIRGVKSGYGALILSTPSGVMSGREAKKAKVGGEALFNIW